MKGLFCSLAFTLGSLGVQAQSTTQVIDNKKVVELSKTGLGADIIIGLINTSATKFDCGLNEVVALKTDSVPDKVISELLKHCNSQKLAESTEMNTNDPVQRHESGIYVYDKNELRKLYATVVTAQQSGGFAQALASQMSYGLAQSGSKAQLSGESANVRSSQESVFYFYFEDSGQKLGSTNWWFSLATSPNEFSLIKLTRQKNTREFTVGTSDAYTQRTGIDEKQKIPFTFSEVKKGIFKVSTKVPLLLGEYGFIYSATIPGAQKNDKVFDFSIAK